MAPPGLDGEPDAVRPERERAHRTRVAHQAPSRRLRPGDLICGNCGEGNANTRRFCSRCGSELVEAEVVKTPWWRRLLPKRKFKTRKALERRKRDSAAKKSVIGVAAKAVFQAVRAVVVVALVIGGIAYATLPAFRDIVNSSAAALQQKAESVVSKTYVPIHPTKVTANLAEPDHPGDLAADSFTNTYWAAPANKGELALVFTFDHPVNLDRMRINNGTADKFDGFFRANRLHLVFSTGKTTDVELKDQPDPQEVPIRDGHGVTSVEVHVMSMYQSLHGSDLAISEIELYQLN